MGLSRVFCGNLFTARLGPPDPKRRDQIVRDLLDMLATRVDGFGTSLTGAAIWKLTAVGVVMDRFRVLKPYRTSAGRKQNLMKTPV